MVTIPTRPSVHSMINFSVTNRCKYITHQRRDSDEANFVDYQIYIYIYMYICCAFRVSSFLVDMEVNKQNALLLLLLLLLHFENQTFVGGTKLVITYCLRPTNKQITSKCNYHNTLHVLTN
jgi:hypothetical protein